MCPVLYAFLQKDHKVMITASMHPENAGESLSALRFGARASLVQNLARQNVAENATWRDPV